MPEIVFLIAAPRTGTNAFRSAISAGSECKNMGEIFHESARSNPVDFNFFRWRAEIFRTESQLSIPTRANSRELWNRYTNYVVSNLSAPFAIADLKYGALHHLNPIFYQPFSRPKILEYINEDSHKVIFLQRREVGQIALSQLFAEEYGVWVYTDRKTTPQIPDKRIQIDAEKYRQRIKSFMEMDRLVMRWLRIHKNILHLYYEELFDSEGKLIPQEAVVLSDFLGHEIQSVVHPVKRTKHKYSEVVENYSDLVAIADSMLSGQIAETRF